MSNGRLLVFTRSPLRLQRFLTFYLTARGRRARIDIDALVPCVVPANSTRFAETWLGMINYFLSVHRTVEDAWAGLSEHNPFPKQVVCGLAPRTHRWQFSPCPLSRFHYSRNLKFSGLEPAGALAQRVPSEIDWSA